MKPVAAVHVAAGQAPVAKQPAVVDFGRGLDERLWRWATISPALLLLLALSVLPLVNLFYTSFFNVSWSGGHSSLASAGLGNYRALAGDTLFRAGLFNTVVFAVFAVGGQMLCGFVLALLCNQVTRGQVSKMVANAAGLTDAIPSAQETFADVAAASPFWLWIERLAGQVLVEQLSELLEPPKR